MITRLVRLIGTGLTGIGLAIAAKIQVLAVIKAIRTSLRVESFFVVVLFAVLFIVVIVCRTTWQNSFPLVLYQKYNRIDEVWFDHDLGPVECGTGYECAKYLVDFCINHDMSLPEYHIQSANPVGNANIDSCLKSYLKSLNI